MGRWTQYDGDDYRLPEGMRRIGYDADTQRYLFQDTNGSRWVSPPGSEYGRLTKISRAWSDPASGVEIPESDQLIPTAIDAKTLDDDVKSSWRMLAPFLLLVCLVPFLVFRLTAVSPSATRDCSASQADPVVVQQGDTCWDIAHTHGVTVDELSRLNARLVCEKLQIGETICVKRNIADQ